MINLVDLFAYFMATALVLPFLGGFIWCMLQFYRFVYWGLRNFSMKQPEWNYINPPINDSLSKEEAQHNYWAVFIILLLIAGSLSTRR